LRRNAGVVDQDIDPTKRLPGTMYNTIPMLRATDVPLAIAYFHPHFAEFFEDVLHVFLLTHTIQGKVITFAREAFGDTQTDAPGTSGDEGCSFHEVFNSFNVAASGSALSNGSRRKPPEIIPFRGAVVQSENVLHSRSRR